MTNSARLETDTRAVFQAALDAIRPDRLVRNSIDVQTGILKIGQHIFPKSKDGRLVIIGGGKAAVGMATGLVESADTAGIGRSRITGWLNVPNDTTHADLPLTVHRCRPVGENLPTSEAVFGTRQIMNLVTGLKPDDLAVCLISGGGSALLTQPVPEISLDEKRNLLIWLDQAEIDIRDRNRVRRELSQIKGGRLAAMAGDHPLVTLIISDILGDPLELIASGPTIPSAPDPSAALKILQRAKTLHTNPEGLPDTVVKYLQSKSHVTMPVHLPALSSLNHEHILIGNLATAVDAARTRAEYLGYQAETRIQSDPHETVEVAAQRMTDWLTVSSHSPRMLIDAGEPLVSLCEHPGLGGRNQQLVLSTIVKLVDSPARSRKFCILSGGTDGEDGNTQAAGALVDERFLDLVRAERLNANHYLLRNDAHSFFAAHGGLLVTGLTGTNVGDIRIVTAVERP